MPKPNRLAPLLAVAVALDLAGFAMVIPDIQLRAEGMGAPGWMIGALLASTFIVQTLASPRWGRLGDRVGRKPVFLACTAASAASLLVYAFAPNVAFLVVSRLLAGLGAANVAAAQAAIANQAAHQNSLQTNQAARATALARLSAAQTFGLVVGPTLGGFVAGSLGSTAVGLAAAALSTLGFLVAAFAQFPTPTPDIDQAPNQSHQTKARFFALAREFPPLAPLVLLAGTAWFSVSMLEGTFARLLKANWGYGQTQFGILFSFESLVMLAVQALAFAWIAKKLPDKPRLVAGYLLQGAGLAFTPFAPALPGLFVASFLFALGVSIANPTVNALASAAVPDSRQGEMFGVLQSARSLGFVAGPIFGGVLFDLRPALPYILAGIICIAAAALAPLAAKAPKPNQNTPRPPDQHQTPLN